SVELATYALYCGAQLHREALNGVVVKAIKERIYLDSRGWEILFDGFITTEEVVEALRGVENPCSNLIKATAARDQASIENIILDPSREPNTFLLWDCLSNIEFLSDPIKVARI